MVLRAEPSQTLCDLEVKNAQNPSRFESKGSMNAAQTFFFAAILKCLNEHALWTCQDFMWWPALTDMWYYVIICDMCGILRESIICHPQKSCCIWHKWREVYRCWALPRYVVSLVVQMSRMTRDMARGSSLHGFNACCDIPIEKPLRNSCCFKSCIYYK